MNRRLSGIKLDDVLLRLGEAETNVCALVSSSPDGWQTKLAWNSVNTYRLGHDQPASTAGLEAFTHREQSSGHLVIGYLSYDFGCGLHNVKLESDDDLSMPLVFAAGFDGWLEFDNVGATIVGSEAFATKVDEILAREVESPIKQAFSETPRPTISRQQYAQAYQQTQTYITAGDVYQINLGIRFEGATESSGRSLFGYLSQGSQSDFRSYIEDGAFEILSYSPERFIRIKDGRITTMPIKGTRPRGQTKAEDQAMKEELLASAKERAELDMITDLMRNDLGEISDIGTVGVAERRMLTSYPTLWHTHSKIIGSLNSELSPIAALCKLSPGGSITGCPKKRAIEIIDEVEFKRRGLYTGSIFAIAPDGELDSSIVIRTVIKQGSKLYLSVAGGIVHDSKESDEYQELLDKVASFIVGSSSFGNDI